MNADGGRVRLKGSGGTPDMSLSFKGNMSGIIKMIGNRLKSFFDSSNNPTSLPNLDSDAIDSNIDYINNTMFTEIGNEDPVMLKKFGRGIYKFAEKQDLLTTNDSFFVEALVITWVHCVNNQDHREDRIRKIILEMTMGIYEASKQSEEPNSLRNVKIRYMCKYIIGKIDNTRLPDQKIT